jgi:mRNA interferase RelE/StbE
MGEQNRPEHTWNILLHHDAEKVLKRLPKEVVERIWEKIATLKSDPRPDGCKRLKGQYNNLYRVRAGDWRISYAIEAEELIILVLEVAPRGGAYKF